MYKIDNFDKRILFELSKDSRQSEKVIGKKINKSKQFVGYRVKRLVENKIILHYQCKINFSAVGVNIFIEAFFKLKNVTEKVSGEINNYLFDNKLIGSYAWHIGVYDLSVSFVERTIPKAKDLLDQFLQKFSPYIFNYDLIFRDHIITYPRRAFFPEKVKGSQMLGSRESETITKSITLTVNEKKIIKILEENPLISYVELASKGGLSVPTVISKVKELQTKEIITHFSAFFDPVKLGLSRHSFLIDFGCKDYKDKLITFCDFNQEVTFIGFNVSRLTQLNVYVKDDMALQKFINKLRENFQEITEMIVIKTISRPKEEFSNICEMLD